MNEHDYHTLENLLSEVAPQADRKFYLALRQKVLNAAEVETLPAKSKRSLFFGIRLWQPVAVGVLVFILIFFLTPMGQTIAQQVMRLGIFFVTNNPSQAEQSIEAPLSEVEVHSLDTVTAAPDEASDMADFTVYYPTYLPAGYTPASDQPVELLLNTRGEIDSAEAMFLSADREYILFYAQHPFPLDGELSSMPLDVGGAFVEQTTVQGNEALWLGNYVWGTERDSVGTLQPVEYNVLIWTIPSSNGAKYYFWLGSEEKLSQEEMLHIADSMAVE